MGKEYAKHKHEHTTERENVLKLRHCFLYLPQISECVYTEDAVN